jgi:hypothetical protein
VEFGYGFVEVRILGILCNTFEKFGGLFAEIVNIVKLKQELSGYPSWVRSQADKDKYVKDYRRSDAVALDKASIYNNARQRTLARLKLNSMWGKSAQNHTRHSELETVLHRGTSSAVAINCFGPQETAFISGLIDRTVTDITQLRCPKLADTSFSTIRCTFACHKSKYVCALRSAYSLAQSLKFNILSVQYAMFPPQPECFPDASFT